MKAFLTCMSGLTALIAATPSLAQTEASAEAKDAAQAPQDTNVGEIIVTALKRETTLQKTPIAITVVTGDALTAGGVTDMRSIETVAPNLNIRTDTVFTQFFVRGVGSTGTGELGDAAITVSIDGEALNRPIALNAAMMDIERVEVLAGPQGTLYGRNATAGAINIIAKKPVPEFAAGGQVEVANYSTLNTQGYVNVPLSDAIATRLSFMTAKHDGYLNNGPGGRGDDQDSWSVRFATLAQLGDNAKLLVTAEHSEVDQASTVPYGISLSSPFGTPVATGSVPGNYTVKVPQDGWPLEDVGFFRVKQSAIRAQLDLDLGFADLTYLGAYRDINSSGRQPSSGRYPELVTFDNKRIDYGTLTQELRLSGGSDEALTWQVGGYYMRETTDLARGAYRPHATATTVAGQYTAFFNFDVVAKSMGAFAQGTLKLADTLKLTLGGRYSIDDKSRSGVACSGTCSLATGNDGGPFTYPNPPTLADGGIYPGSVREAKDKKFTYLAGLDWQVAPDNMVYGKISTGYKAGGFDNVVRYKPETLTAYEIGSKNRFFDRRLQLNLAAFYYDYKDMQATVFVSTAVGLQTLNVGKARNYGAEADVNFAVTDSDKLRLSVNYLNAKFTDFQAVQARVGAANAAVNLAGNRPIQSPKWTIAYGYDHTFDLESGAKITAGVSGRFKSAYFVSIDNFQADRQKSFSNTDLNLSYSSPDERWKVTAFVRNLEDYRPLGFTTVNSGFDYYAFVLSGAPRTFGGRLEYTF